MADLQQAADDVGVIAETVKELTKLLDKFQADHGDAIYARVEAAWPDAYTMNSPAALFKLERDLTTPSER